MYNCVIVDDEDIARNVIKQYIERVDILKLSYESEDPVKAFNYISQNTPDILFLDINMPDLDGISLLNSLLDRPTTIFTTAYREYAVEGFEANAIDYLVKPFSYERFMKAIHKVLQLKSTKSCNSSIDFSDNKSRACILVKDGKKTYRVSLEEINYIESLGEYMKIHTNKQTVITLGSLYNFTGNLPSDRFCRIHNSYTINLDKVHSFNTFSVDIGNCNLPVSRKYRDNFRKCISENGFEIIKNRRK
jgi:DNA-binding LytR/AlgR family response regulator